MIPERQPERCSFPPQDAHPTDGVCLDCGHPVRNINAGSHSVPLWTHKEDKPEGSEHRALALPVARCIECRYWGWEWVEISGMKEMLESEVLSSHLAELRKHMAKPPSTLPVPDYRGRPTIPSLGSGKCLRNLPEGAAPSVRDDHWCGEFIHRTLGKQLVPYWCDHNVILDEGVHPLECPASEHQHYRKQWRYPTEIEEEPMLSTASKGHPMTREEACDVMGIPHSATRNEVIVAHRALGRHMDRPSADYAAVCRAKARLLED